MGRSSRVKGVAAERELVNLLKARGVQATRVPLSGGAGGIFSGDVLVGKDQARWEVKIRKDGFRMLYRWLEDAEALAIRANQAAPGEKAPGWLVVMRLEDVGL